MVVATTAVLSLSIPASASAGAVVTPVPTFPYPSVTIGTQFNASITLFNNSTGAEAGAGVTVGASNVDLFPSCADSVIVANNCPTAEAGVFQLSSTATSGAGGCPPGAWTISEAAPGRFRFTPPAPVGLLPGQNCTIDFTATALKLPQFDGALALPGTQTNQVAAVDAFSPVTGLTVRNSGSGSTTVLAAPTTRQGNQNAQLNVSEGCKRIATATVTGQDIQSVIFRVDGKRHATDTSAPFKTRVKAFKLSKGRHKLTADVTFTQASGKLAATFEGGFLRCRPRKQPNFTG